MHFCSSVFGQVCTPDDLSIQIITAYNFVVDNNIESPSGIPLRAAHIGAKICNTSADTLVNLFIYTGNYTGPTGTGGTPGTYPNITCPNATWPGLTGTFSLYQVGGSSDAIRWIGNLLPGQCVVQYWLIEYPLLDNNGNAVFGSCPDQTDDLRLDYDIWARFADDESPSVYCYKDATRSATLRCEISASSNKIWPNVPSQVPQEYIDALSADGYEPGWDFDESANVGEILHLQGIWYSFGHVNKGFDNNGDLVPDYNAWVQPVGDPTSVIPMCYRLVHVHGLLLVKTPDLGTTVIPFDDQMYFENLDPDNTNVSGLIFYDFAALTGPCASSLTPYQESASGSDNEKFNSDFGSGFSSDIYIVNSVFTKSVSSLTTPLNSNLTYTLSLSNSATTAMGYPEYGVPIVLQENIPSGMEYVSGSASTVSGSYTFDLLYSTDQGVTWTSFEPVPASDITSIQWWMKQSLGANSAISVTFQLHCPLDYPSPLIHNWAGASLGNSTPFDTDDALSFISGNNQIGDRVFADIGTGIGGIKADGIQNGTEPGIQHAFIRVYYDIDNSGNVTSADYLWDTAYTGSTGNYLFTGLPNGHWLVIINDTSVTSLPAYATYGLTTHLDYRITFTLGNSIYLTADFGFAEPLSILKSTVKTAYIEGDTITYTIRVTNSLIIDPDVAISTGNTDTCEYYSWASYNTQDGGNKWINEANAVGAPNGTFSRSGFTTSPQRLRSSMWNIGYLTGQNITKVEAMLVYYATGNDPDDIIEMSLTQYPGPTDIASSSFGPAYFPASANADTAFIDVTAAKPSWLWTDFPNTASSGTGIDLNGSRNGSTSDNLYVDAVGFRISATCSSTQQGGAGEYESHLSLDPVPLKDTFDLARLTLVSSSIPYATLNSNIITWNNLGPINPGAYKVITLKFVAKEVKGGSCSGVSINNKASSTDPEYADGDAANFASDTSQVNISGKTSISGFIWKDGDTDGWQGANGYETGESFVSGIRMNLYGCYVSGTLYTATNQAKSCAQVGGAWQLVRYTFTNSNGYYEFSGLNAGYYVVRAIKNGLLNGSTQYGDPNRTATGVCASPGCDNRWNDSTLNVNNAAGQIPLLQNCRDTLKVNFGYAINPAVWGRVWEDIDSSGAKGAGETYLSGWTVKLYNDANLDGIPDGASLATNITNSLGEFTFTNLTGGNHYLIIPDTTSVWNATWDPGSPSRLGYYRFTAPTNDITGPYDFGYKKSGTSDIGDLLFWDWNGDGIYNGSDAGINNITVELWKDNNNDGYGDILVTFTLTNAAGSYSFRNLPAGNWIVVVKKEGAILTARPTKDPDETGLCTICNSKSTVTTDGINDQLGEDFGYQPAPCGSIGDLVYRDQNGNGINDGTYEIGIADISLYLYQDLDGNNLYSFMDSMVSGPTGSYLFDSLPNGNYRVVVNTTDPQLPILSTPTSYSTYEFTVSNCETNITTLGCTNCPTAADFGFGQPATIGNMIYWDANENGEQDYTESGIAEVSVNLYRKVDENFTFYATTATSNFGAYSAGYYEFTNLPADTFLVVVDQTDPQLLGATQTADPDNDGYPCSHPYIGTLYPPCDHQDTLILFSGQNYSLADFGYSPPGVIGDFVWEDFDNDGVIDPGEPGKTGIAVYLCNSSDPCTASSPDLISSDTTDPDGHYIFYQVPNGTYSVSVGTPAGYSNTSGPQSVGITGTVVMSGGAITTIDGSTCTDCDLNVDFGIRMDGSYSLSGNVCIDDGSLDGLCGNTGDQGQEGIQLYLYRFNGVSFEQTGITTTGSNGDYTFAGQSNGTYIISLATNIPQLEGAALTTTDEDSPSGDIVETTNTVYHNNIILNNSSISDFDFAFSTPEREFGDLPDSYSTNLASNGARHEYNANWKMGAVIDTEPDAFVSADALGDDNETSPDDEDGVTFNGAGTWDPGETVSVSILYTIPAGQQAHLIAWIDWEQNGSFIGNLVFDTLVSASGSPGTYSFAVPSFVSYSSTLHAARFRLFADEQPLPQLAFSGLPSGINLYGEVEDYLSALMGPPNDPPVALDDLITTVLNTPVTGMVLSNDSDPEGNPITVNTLPVTPTSHGSVTINSNGSYTYEPNPGYTGIDSFVYEICDPSGECDHATVTIIIHSCFIAPARPGMVQKN